MARCDPKKLNSKERMKYLDILWTSIANLKSREEVKNFFKDLLSETEAIMLARRIIIAKMLLEGKRYEQIQKELKVGKGTIANVHHWLVSGFGGYKKAINEFEKILKKRLNRKKKDKMVEPFTFEWLKKRYPLHFLLFNLIDEAKRLKSK